MTKNSTQLDKLIERDGPDCHYCGVRTKRIRKGSIMATRDHIVPRFLGGRNVMNNYVLACSRCNGKRGNQLRYCDCDICETRINNALSDNQLIRLVFDSMVGFNKPKVRIISGRYSVKIGHGPVKTFDSFEEAISFSTNTSLVDRN